MKVTRLAKRKWLDKYKAGWLPEARRETIRDLNYLKLFSYYGVVCPDPRTFMVTAV